MIMTKVNRRLYREALDAWLEGRADRKQLELLRDRWTEIRDSFRGRVRTALDKWVVDVEKRLAALYAP